MKTIRFNINDNVKVRLTEEGHRILQKQGEALINDLPSLKKFVETNYAAPKIDEDGYTTYQLWELMSTFGNHLGNGCGVPFDTEIIILIED